MKNGIDVIVNAGLCENNPKVAERRAKVLLLIRDGVRHITDITEATGATTRAISYGDIHYLANKGFVTVPNTPQGDAWRRRGVSTTVPAVTLTEGGKRLAELIDS